LFLNIHPSWQWQARTGTRVGTETYPLVVVVVGPATPRGITLQAIRRSSSSGSTLHCSEPDKEEKEEKKLSMPHNDQSICITHPELACYGSSGERSHRRPRRDIKLAKKSRLCRVEPVPKDGRYSAESTELRSAFVVRAHYQIASREPLGVPDHLLRELPILPEEAVCEQ